MISGYHTGGLLLHDIGDAIGELSRLGYRSVAIRPHAGMFHPNSTMFSHQLLRIGDAIKQSNVQCVIDLDAVYMHDATDPCGPSLVADNPQEQESAIRWIQRWKQFAKEIGAKWLTFSSGPAGSSSSETQLSRLSSQLDVLTTDADPHDIRLAIRPRSGDVIATVAQFERFRQWLVEPTSELVYLAADVGEMLAAGELPIADRLSRNLESLACVYLCDHSTGSHPPRGNGAQSNVDQRIGQGDVVLSRVIEALVEHGFQGPAIARVEGHCELGLIPAREATAIFQKLL